MIKIEYLRKSFGAVHVLKGSNLTVRIGEVVSNIDWSGSGKSTLLSGVSKGGMCRLS